MVYTGRFNTTKFIECLKNFMRYRRNPVFLIMDGHPVHKAKAIKEYIKELKGRLEIYLLPSYAPDLNPDELVWNQMRNIGTSKKPLKKGESLKRRAVLDLESIKNKKKLIKSFFKNDKVSYAAAQVVTSIRNVKLTINTHNNDLEFEPVWISEWGDLAQSYDTLEMGLNVEEQLYQMVEYKALQYLHSMIGMVTGVD